MKKLIFILAITIAILSSCTTQENVNSKLVEDKNVTKEEISDSLLTMSTDTTLYNSNVIMSEDNKTIYIFKNVNGEQILSHKFVSEAESEELNWGLFLMFAIILFIISI